MPIEICLSVLAAYSFSFFSLAPHERRSEGLLRGDSYLGSLRFLTPSL
jgi:hypothetical protein